ncbi:MAG: TRAP transporter small permease, partial [Xanthomonadales bacterium]|nr:TRAP transporter small permease [Xanthomonadales bacterium]
MTRALDVFLKFFMASLMALMVCAVTWQVFSRYVMGDPAAWTEEVARMLLIWVGLLGGVYAYRLKAHLGLDLLAMKVGPAGRRRLEVITDISCGAFALAVLVIGGGLLVQLTWELKQTTAALGIPMAWVYVVLPLSGVLIVYYSI